MPSNFENFSMEQLQQLREIFKTISDSDMDSSGKKLIKELSSNIEHAIAENIFGTILLHNVYTIAEALDAKPSLPEFARKIRAIYDYFYLGA